MIPTLAGLAPRARSTFRFDRIGRRPLISLFASALLWAGSPAARAAAPDYPQQPVSIIVPFAPGGSLDATARVLGKKLDGILGPPVVIANKPGAGSAVGARAA